MLQVFIGGTCEPNPGGSAAYGLIVVRDGSKVLAKGQVIGAGASMSNNVAEYAGLLEFLRLWSGINPATIYSDSQLLVNQMSGIWQAHNGLYLESYHQSKEGCSGKPIMFQWIPRDQNQEADALSLMALSAIGIKPRRRR